MLISSCKNESKRKKIGNYLVEAKFISDTVPEGLAKYYEKDKLIAQVNYHNKLKNGISINFHGNGTVYDSVNFKNGLENGYRYVYDSLGNLGNKCYFFNGYKIGPEVYFVNGIPREYFFNSFEKVFLYYVSYDSIGKVIKSYGNILNSFPYNARIDGNRAYGIFSYFVNPPGSNMQYELVVKDSGSMKELPIRIIPNDEVFMDTVLLNHIVSSKYYIKATMFDSNVRKIKVFYDELIYK